MEELKIGDPVEVIDEGLAILRRMMKQAGVDVPPNHHGIIDEILDDGTIMVRFPIGGDDPEEHSQIAPYPPSKVRYRVAK